MAFSGSNETNWPETEEIAKAVSKSRSEVFREVLSATFLERHPKPSSVQNALMFDPPRRVVVFGQQDECSDLICETLRNNAYIPLHLTVSFGLDAQWYSTFARFAQSCFIDYDYLSYQVDPITFATKLRKDHPDLPIILFSKSFSANDFSAERSRICDASLVRDFVADDVLRAMDNAYSNHMAYDLLRNIDRH